MANLTGVPVSKIQFFVVLRGVPMISCLRRPSGEAFGYFLEGLFAVQSCLFTVLFVVRSRIFRSLSEGHCGRCALHFSHALEAFCFSAKRLDDVGVSRMCRSAIPLTWVTCRDNMSVCVVMLFPRVSRHCGTLEVNRCKALWVEDPRAWVLCPGAMPKVMGRQRIKRARGAREDSSIYIYI